MAVPTTYQRTVSRVAGALRGFFDPIDLGAWSRLPPPTRTFASPIGSVAVGHA
jgi:hypothetical protein